MFLYMAPKKAGVAKKSQQKKDREKRMAENMEATKVEKQVNVVNNGLFANAKGGEDILNKLRSSEEIED